MINRKSESIKLLESIQTAMKEDKANDGGLTQEEINQIKSSLNDNFYKVFSLRDNNEFENRSLDIMENDGEFKEGYIGYSSDKDGMFKVRLYMTPGHEFEEHIETNTLQEITDKINSVVDAHVNANLPSAKEFEQYLSEKALKIINGIRIENSNGWKYITSPYKAYVEYGFDLTLDPKEDNKLFGVCEYKNKYKQEGMFNTWQEAVQWANEIVDKYYTNEDLNNSKSYDEDDEDEDEEDEENETLYDLVAVYDKNKNILFSKKFEVGEEEPYIMQFDEVKEAISFAENNANAEVAILWDGAREGESYDVEIWNKTDGDISDDEDKEADYDYYTDETEKLLEN